MSTFLFNNLTEILSMSCKIRAQVNYIPSIDLGIK